MKSSIGRAACLVAFVIVAITGHARADTEQGPCSKLECENGGTCIARNGRAVCKCPTGFGGKRCQVRAAVDPFINPINIGACPPIRYSWGHCGGTFCKSTSDCPGNKKCCPSVCGRRLCMAVREITSPCSKLECENGGTCIAINGRTFCKCPTGFGGKRCEVRVAIDPFPRPPVSRDPCAYFECQNGGVCSAPRDIPYCTCPRGFSGRRCEIDEADPQTSPCSKLECENGGTCIPRNERSFCKCPTGFGGKRCQVRAAIDPFNPFRGGRDPCDNFECQNGGRCISVTRGRVPICICPGFTGRHCEIKVSDSRPIFTSGSCPIIRPGIFRGICGGTFCKDDSDCSKKSQRCCQSACGGRLCTTVYHTGGIVPVSPETTVSPKVASSNTMVANYNTTVNE